MALSCIVFDCDGIIVESAETKIDAFTKIAEEIAPHEAEAFTVYVRLHGGVSRVEKFIWLYQRAFSRDILPEEMQYAIEKFEEYSEEKVLAAPFVPGIMESLERWHKRLPLFVASGMPQENLDRLLQHRKLTHFFQGIYGTPPAKAVLLANCVRQAKARPEDSIMIGDSKTDSDAALIAGTKFYGRGPYFQDKKWPWGEDLTQLNDYLETLAKQ